MSAPKTRCDIIRDFVAGGCAGEAPAPACVVGAMANSRLQLFASRYAPSALYESAADAALRRRIQATLETDIASAEKALGAEYPGTPADVLAIGWGDFGQCLHDPSGGRAGPNGTVYFGQKDALALGMNPQWPVGGKIGASQVCKSDPCPAPLWSAYLLNPDMFFIVLAAILLLVLVLLLVRARRAAVAAGRRLAPAPR